MKTLLHLISTILFSSMLVACTSNTPTPDSVIVENKVATIVAATLSAMPSSTPIPTQTSVPTPINTVQPSDIYQNADFGFECLYPVHMFFTEWGGVDETLPFSMSFRRLEDKEKGFGQIIAEVAISVYANPGKLQLEQWLSEHTGPDTGTSTVWFLRTSDPIRFTVNGHPAIFFEAEGTMVGTSPRLLIENGQQIVSIVYYPSPSVSVREEFLLIASSFKIGLSNDHGTIDNELYEALDSALSALSY